MYNGHWGAGVFSTVSREVVLSKVIVATYVAVRHSTEAVYWSVNYQALRQTLSRLTLYPLSFQPFMTEMNSL